MAMTVKNNTWLNSSTDAKLDNLFDFFFSDNSVTRTEPLYQLMTNSNKLAVSKADSSVSSVSFPNFEFYLDTCGALKGQIDRVIFNDPATIIYWKDGQKTVVKAHNEPFDPEKGFAMAVVKYAFGNKGNFNEVLKKYLPVENSER